MMNWLRRGAGRHQDAIDGINLFFGAMPAFELAPRAPEPQPEAASDG